MKKLCGHDYSKCCSMKVNGQWITIRMRKSKRVQFTCPTADRIELNLKYGVPIAPFTIKGLWLDVLNTFKAFLSCLKIDNEIVERLIDIPEGILLIKSSGTELIRR